VGEPGEEPAAALRRRIAERAEGRYRALA
jgi:hypothetical protein